MSEYHQQENNFLNDETDKNLKCGIIMVSKSCAFSLCCSVCKSQFRNFKGFTKHITETHSYYDFDDSLDDEDNDETMNYDEDDYLSHEPSVEVSYLPQTMDASDPDDSQQNRYQDEDNSLNNSSIQLPIMKYEDDERAHLSSMFDDSSVDVNKSAPTTDGKMFPCHLCEKSYYYSSSLMKHVRKYHPSKSSSQTPGQSVSSPSAGIITERRRPNAPLHQCPACPAGSEGFRTKRLLEQHNIEVHINARKFTCMFCPNAYNLKKDLTQHEQTMHLDKRPYRCDICAFAFKERKHLIRHERTHTGEKPFKCPLCAESFTRMDKKKHHMKKHEEEGDYVPIEGDLDLPSLNPLDPISSHVEYIL